MSDDQTLFGTLQQLSGARYSEIAANARDAIDFDLLRVAYEKGVALPTAGETDRDKFHGGFVVESEAGHHANVVYEDVSSMYPNIMRMCNISFETIIGTPADLFTSEYEEDDCVWSYIDPRPVKKLDEDELYSNFTDGEYKMVHDPNQGQIKWRSEWDEIKDNLVKCYFLDPQQYGEGIIASRADDYITWNKQYTGVMYSATKQQRNGLYGVNGDTGFRLFDWRCAEAVTIGGRLILGFMMDFFLGDDSPLEGYIPLGDTDGIGLAITSESTREAVLEAVEAREDDAHEYGFDQFAEETFGVTEHYIATEAESYSPRIFIPDDGSGGVKKTYAKWVTWDEGDYVDEIDVTGFEAVRSDVADVTPQIQTDVLQMLLRNDPSTAREQVFPYVRELRKQFETHSIDVAEIGKRMGLSKHPSKYGTQNRRPQPIFRGAKYSEAYIDGESFESGGKPFEFRVKDIGCDKHPDTFSNHHFDGDELFYAEADDPVDVISVEDPTNVPDCAEIAYTDSPYTLDPHWEMTVGQPLDNIFRAMGWSMDDCLDGTEQASVGDW